MLDVETTPIRDGEIPKTKFWGIATLDGDYRKFRNTKELLKFLRQTKKQEYNLLHHANFDIIQLLVDGARMEIHRCHNGKLIRCKLKESGCLTTNTYSVFPISMAKIFAAFGFKKTELGKLDKRNYEDCVNGLKCCTELDAIFQRVTNGVSPLQCGTIAGAGFKALQQSIGYKMPIDDRFLAAYRGGRVDVFNTNFFPDATKWDINSSYPASILECPEQGTLWKIRVKTRDFYCPFFAANITENLMFPNGEFVSWVFQDVYEKYIEPYATDTSIKILSKHEIDFTWLDQAKPFFQKVYTLKQRETGGIKEVSKFLLNASYGRMGLKGESERARIVPYIPDRDEVIFYKLNSKEYLIFDFVVHECKSNFPFAAYITDNARGRLYAKAKQNRAYYCDTDSIVSQSFRGKSKDGCGDWKDEGRGAFQAFNVKDYVWWGENGNEDEHRKGGHGKTQWTLKQFAAGKTAAYVKRERITELKKRIVTGKADGWTLPLTV